MFVPEKTDPMADVIAAHRRARDAVRTEALRSRQTLERWRYFGDPGEPGFVNGASSGSQNPRAGFMKDPYNEVHFCGYVLYTDPLNQAIGRIWVIDYLPLGFRPPQKVTFPTLSGGLTGYTIEVWPSGAVEMVTGQSSGGPTLEGVHFSAA